MRRIAPSSGVILLSAGIVFSTVLLLIAVHLTKNPVYQTILLLVSMGALFYSSHPLAHYAVAGITRVGVRYFFVGRSDFRKLGGAMGALGKSVFTIGIKLEPARVRRLSRSRGAILFGSGAIVSNALLAIELLAARLAGLSTLALALGAVLLFGSLATELLFSTKVGDLAKMKRELSS
jgi:hypothetical protein